MKKNIFDIVAPILFVVALVIIYFFWGCQWDLYITILGVAVAVVFALIAYKKNKKIKELTKNNK